MTTEKCDASWCDLHDTTPWNSQCSYEGTERCFSNMKIQRSKEKRLKRKDLEEINEWLEVKIGFLKLEIDELEEKYTELKKSAVAVRLAITIEGENPKRHRKTMAHHRAEWPYLWKRIDELVKLIDKQ